MKTRIKSHLRKQGRRKVRVKSHLRNYGSNYTKVKYRRDRPSNVFGSSPPILLRPEKRFDQLPEEEQEKIFRTMFPTKYKRERKTTRGLQPLNQREARKSMKESMESQLRLAMEQGDTEAIQALTRDLKNYGSKIQGINVNDEAINFWGKKNVEKAISSLKKDDPFKGRASVMDREIEMFMEGESKSGAPFFDPKIKLGPKGELERKRYNLLKSFGSTPDLDNLSNNMFKKKYSDLSERERNFVIMQIYGSD